jgi:hypothetical protein
MLDYTKLSKKLVPGRDGEPYTSMRTGTVDAINSDGTVDIEMSSGVLVPDVPRLATVSVVVGDVVQMISFRGSLLVIGTSATGASGSAQASPRVATTERESNSSNITSTTESTVDSVTASLVAGRTYRVTWAGAIFSSVKDGVARARIREDNSTGTQLAFAQAETANQTASAASNYRMEAEYTAPSTASKTFVAAVQRLTGTGNVVAQASATNPTYLYVDYVRN